MHNQNFSQQITANAFLALGCNEKKEKESCFEDLSPVEGTAFELLVTRLKTYLHLTIPLHQVYYILFSSEPPPFHHPFYSVTFVNCH